MKKYLAHIWLDDVRLPNIPEEAVVWVKDYASFVAKVKDFGKDISNCIVHFDHDLQEEKDGYDCAKWLVNWCIENNYPVPDHDIQSANPVGRENIESIFKSYNKVFNNKEMESNMDKQYEPLYDGNGSMFVEFDAPEVLDYGPTPEQEKEFTDYIDREELKELRKQVKDYKELISFISDSLTGDVRPVIESISELNMMEVIGIVDGTFVVKNNTLFIEAEVPSLDYDRNKKEKYLFEWQPNSNYAVHQRTEYVGDCYYGYMLFPKYGGKKYLCVFYRC